MTRRKIDKTEKLSRKIGLRVSDPFYKKMEEWLKHSNCRTVAELARRILYKEQIIWYHKDTQEESTAAELARIRDELRAIGKNINQITKYFNSTQILNEKVLHSINVQEEYNKVGLKVDQLMAMVAEILKQW